MAARREAQRARARPSRHAVAAVVASAAIAARGGAARRTMPPSEPCLPSCGGGTAQRGEPSHSELRKQEYAQAGVHRAAGRRCRVSDLREARGALPCMQVAPSKVEERAVQLLARAQGAAQPWRDRLE